ncbi:NAD kinase [Pelomyxa schiedti]|nr:NAD kinase [Pelomyxa schiedti]
MMLHAIRSHWRLRIPFLGINCGHVGFLLNEPDAVFSLEATSCTPIDWPSLASSFSSAALPTPPPLPTPVSSTTTTAEPPLPTPSCSATALTRTPSLRRIVGPNELTIHKLPLLFVEAIQSSPTSSSEPIVRQLAFNDVWVERSTGQTAWMELSVNGEIRIPKLIADGLLISTAAGSTAYAQAMGACPIPVGCPLLCVVGNNVAFPLSWKCAYLPLDAEITIKSVDPAKRPIRGFVDGLEMGNLLTLRLRASSIADCSLLFLKSHDMVTKLSSLQFPHTL